MLGKLQTGNITKTSAKESTYDLNTVIKDQWPLAKFSKQLSSEISRLGHLEFLKKISYPNSRWHSLHFLRDIFLRLPEIF